MVFDPNTITPDFEYPIGTEESWASYFALLKAHMGSALKDYDSSRQVLQALPIFFHSPLPKTKGTFSVFTLVPGKYTEGWGQTLTETLSTFLIPGRHTPVLLARSLRVRLDGEVAFCKEIILETSGESNLLILQINLPKILRLLRISVLGAYHARKVMSKKRLSTAEQKILLSENLSDVFYSNNRSENSLFAGIPRKFVESAQKSELYALVDHLLTSSTYTFKRDIFQEMQRYYFLLPKAFQKQRKNAYTIRILSSFYLLRKYLAYEAPDTDYIYRILSFQSSDKKSPSKGVGIILCYYKPHFANSCPINLLLTACRKLVPHCELTPNASFADDRSDSSIASVYIELQQHSGVSLPHRERTMLKKQLDTVLREQKGCEHHSITSLPKESFSQIYEKYVHAPFTSYNDKEKNLRSTIENELLEKNRCDDELLSQFIHGFSSSQQPQEYPVAVIQTAYFLLHSLLNKDSEHTPFLSTAHSIDSHYLIAFLSKRASFLPSLAASAKTPLEKATSSQFELRGRYLGVFVIQYSDEVELAALREQLASTLSSFQNDPALYT